MNSAAMPRLEPMRDFGPFDGRAWLNTAHQGALPRVAARRAQEALQMMITHRDQRRNRSIRRFLKERGVEIALRGGMLRISPHLHNTRDDVERALDLLTQAHGSLSRRGGRLAAAAPR